MSTTASSATKMATTITLSTMGSAAGLRRHPVKRARSGRLGQGPVATLTRDGRWLPGRGRCLPCRRGRQSAGAGEQAARGAVAVMGNLPAGLRPGRATGCRSDRYGSQPDRHYLLPERLARVSALTGHLASTAGEPHARRLPRASAPGCRRRTPSPTVEDHGTGPIWPLLTNVARTRLHPKHPRGVSLSG